MSCNVNGYSTTSRSRGSGTPVDTSGGDQTFSPASEALFVGGSGNVKVDFKNGNTGVTMQVLAGLEYDWQITKIYQTGTDATNLRVMR